MTVDETLPKYTRWGQVPDDLYTRTQLANLTPPRRLAKGAEPQARVLYHGNKYAPLFHIDDSEEKPAPTAAQLAAVAKAREASITCRRCGGYDIDEDSDRPKPLGKGRTCSRCDRVLRAWSSHLSAGANADRWLGDAWDHGALALAVDDPQHAGHVTAVAYRPGDAVAGAGEVLADLAIAPTGHAPEPGEVEPVDAFRVLTTAVAAWSARNPDFPVVVWEHARQAIVRMQAPDIDWDTNYWDATPEIEAARRQANDRAKEHPWVVDGRRWVALREPYARYFAEYRDPLNPVTLRWQLPIPGVGSTPVDEARALMRLLRGMARGEEPVSSRAPWVLHPPSGDAEAG